MLFSSTIDSSIKSTAELVILSYSTQREIVPLPQTYEDVEYLACEIFGLDGHTALVLKTQDLDACRGKPAVINRGAWDALRPLLCTIEIEIYDEKREVLKLGRKPRCCSCSSSNSQSDFGTHGTDNYSSEGEDKEEFVVLKPFGSSKGKARLVDEEDDGTSTTKTSVACGVPEQPREKSHSPVTSSTHPTNLVVRDNSRSEKADVGPESSHSRRTSPAESSSSKLVATASLQGRDAVVRTPSSATRNEDAALSAPTKVKQSKPTSPSSPHELARNVKDEPASASQQSQSTDKFLVIIEHRESGKQALFRTRGDYPVSKVLMSACKSFKLDYDRSCLVLIDEQRKVVCNPEDTMAREGARENSRFVIEEEEN